MRRIYRTLILTMCAFVVLSNVTLAANDDARQTIVVYGASGKIGGLIVAEALGRGHTVTGVSRNPANLSVEHENFSAAMGDVTDVESFTKLASGADSIVISVRGDGGNSVPEDTTHARAARTAISALSGFENAPYVIQVGGATSVYEDREEMVARLPMPAEPGTPFFAMLMGHLVALEAYRASDIDWTVITPAYEITGWTPEGITTTNGTGQYRTSTTEHLVDAGGKSRIDVADLAGATIDELENRTFVRQRFMVGY